MKAPMPHSPALALAALLLGGSALQAAQAQSFRASDGQPKPVALLEPRSLPAGTEGSPVSRNLVRNMLQPN